MRLAVLALLVLVAASLPAAASRQVLPRSTVDRPNEARGPQIHAVYAVARDGADRGLDTDGTIETTVRSWDSWLASQTQGKGGLRLDTAAGALDVTYFVDPHTQDEIASRGAFVRDLLETDLHAAGFDRPDTIYAVYYDGPSASPASHGGALPGDSTGLELRCRRPRRR
jgi:hypothetical protein